MHLGKHRVEAQIRTELQHLWAELSEFLADKIGQDVKYGGGPQDIRKLLTAASWEVKDIESAISKVGGYRKEADERRDQIGAGGLSDTTKNSSQHPEIEKLDDEIASYVVKWRSMFHDIVERLLH